MIITVTMNPAIDKTVEIDRLRRGGLNRIKKAEYDAGGKGINVSKTLRELGGGSIATGFLGGSAGGTIAAALAEKGIENDFVRVEGETRTNTKVLEEDGVVTELNEPGPEIKAAQTELLMKKLEGYAGKGTLFVLSGSVPAGVDKHIYARIIRMVHEKEGAVLLDADGELLRFGLAAGPDIVKPNRKELEAYAGYENRASREELFGLADKLRELGAETAAISLGGEGALFARGNYKAFSPALAVKAHSTVGAGDAMVAALAFAWEKNLGAEETFRLCMASAAGAVTTAGTKPPDRMLVESLAGKVLLIKEGGILK